MLVNSLEHRQALVAHLELLRLQNLLAVGEKLVGLERFESGIGEEE